MKDEHTLHNAIRWVSARELARIIGIVPQTLANWRHRDLAEGRDHAAPGKPFYRRFGRAVRYALDQNGVPLLEPLDLRAAKSLSPAGGLSLP